MYNTGTLETAKRTGQLLRAGLVRLEPIARCGTQGLFGNKLYRRLLNAIPEAASSRCLCIRLRKGE